MRPPTRCTRELLAVELLCLALLVGAAVSSYAQVEARHEKCADLPKAARPPDYSIQHRTYSPKEPRILGLHISVHPEVAWGDETAMVGLACRLASDFPNEQTIDALIFDDKKAARNLLLYYEEQPHHVAYLWHLRGRYKLDREKRQQFIDLVVPVLRDELPSLRRERIWASLD